MTQFSIPGPLAVAIVFVFIVVLLITGRALIRSILRPLGAVGRRFVAPVYKVTLRPIVRGIRSVLRGVAEAAQPSTPVQVGTAPYKALLHLINVNSMSEVALGEVPRSVRNLVDRKGIFFRSVNANRAVENVHESLSPDEAKSNLEAAGKFYENSIEHGINPTILYEDSEEALIIGILKDLDTAFFYVLRRIKRNVSRNVVKVITVMTAIVIIAPLIISYFADPLDRNKSTVKTLFAGEYNSLAYLIVCLALAAALILLRYTYSNSARYNGQQLNYFVQTYFSRLLNQYKSAATSYSNVLNDRTAQLDTVERNANLWFMNMHWLSARQWLLELFVRNMTFQIGRNWIWTIVFIPLSLFLIAFGIYFSLAHWADGILSFVNSVFHVQYTTDDFNVLQSKWTLVPSITLFVLYLIGLTDLLKKFWYEITPRGWLGFSTMNIKAAIEHNVGSIAREVVDKRRNPYGAPAPFPPVQS